VQYLSTADVDRSVLSFITSKLQQYDFLAVGTPVWSAFKNRYRTNAAAKASYDCVPSLAL